MVLDGRHSATHQLLECTSAGVCIFARLQRFQQASTKPSSVPAAAREQRSPCRVIRIYLLLENILVHLRTYTSLLGT